MQKPISFSPSVLAALLVERVDVDAVLEVGDRHGHELRARDLHQVGAARQQLLVAHPDHVGGELVGDRAAASCGRGQDVAARDVDLVGEGQRHGVAGLGRGQIAAAGR